MPENINANQCEVRKNASANYQNMWQGNPLPLSVEANTLLAHKMPHKKGSAHKKNTYIMPISRN